MSSANQHKELITALFHLVWADDIVTPNEVAALSVVLRKLGLSLPEVICLMDQNLAAPPPQQTALPLDQLFAHRRPSEDDLRLLLSICFSDGSIQPEQIGYIEGLILRLGLTSHELEQLRTEAIGELKP